MYVDRTIRLLLYYVYGCNLLLNYWTMFVVISCDYNFLAVKVLFVNLGNCPSSYWYSLFVLFSGVKRSCSGEYEMLCGVRFSV